MNSRQGAALRLATAGVGVACALLSGGCAGWLSHDDERALEMREAERVERVMGIADHATARGYVAEIGRRLASHSGRPDVGWRFDVVDTPEPSAFALPGGPVYVSRGLVALLNDEAELAGVLAHEIGHGVARHSVRRASASEPFVVLAGLPGALVGRVNRTLGRIVAAPGLRAANVVLAPFGREQERDADRIGTEIAAAAGYDPIALARALRTLEREDRMHEGATRNADFFASHPATPGRMRAIEQHAAGLRVGPAPPFEPTRGGFLARFEDLLLGENPSNGAFVGQAFVHPGLGVRIEFPAGWQTERQPTLVLGLDPAGEGRVLTTAQVATESDDPMAGVEADELSEPLRERVERTSLGGLETARLLAIREGTALFVHWIAFEGRVYRVASICPLGSFDQQRTRLLAIANSFGPIPAEELDALREQRLALVAAEPGESLAALLARSGSSWAPATAAIANGLPMASTPLAEGFVVKVARERPFRVAGATSSSDSARTSAAPSAGVIW